MSDISEATPLTDAHREAIAACIADVRALVANGGVTRETLAAIKTRLLALAARGDLFDPGRFPVLDAHAGDHSTIYRLAEDDDHGFALFAVGQRKGNLSPPHDHTTWAVIAGVEGEEHQKIYTRTDDGAEKGRGTVEVAREFTVMPGQAIAFMPDDIHSIHVLGDRSIMHLHMYGKALEEMTGRVAYDRDAGTYATFPAHRDIMDDPGDG